MRSRRWIAALGLWFTSVALHAPVTRVLTAVADRWGFDRLQAWQAVFWPAVGIPVVGACWWAARRRERDVFWALWGAAVAVAWVALSQTRAEAVHFVQYAAVVLVLPGPLRVRLALATALGVVDEGFQATVLYPEQALDWKDVVFDGLGAVGGGLGVWSWRG